MGAVVYFCFAHGREGLPAAAEWGNLDGVQVGLGRAPIVLLAQRWDAAAWMDERLKHKLLLAKEHFDRREFDHAEPLLLQVLEKNDRFADVHNMLGISRHARGDFQGAREAFDRAVALNPNYTEALLNLVVTLNDLGAYDDSRALFERVGATASPNIEGAVQDPYALGKIANKHAEIAQAYADAGYLDEAIGELEKGVKLRPTFADLHVKLGSLQRDRGNLAAALASFQTACSANPRYAPARVQLGITLTLQGDKEAAKVAFREALEIDPEHKVAAMYLRLAEGRSA